MSRHYGRYRSESLLRAAATWEVDFGDSGREGVWVMPEAYVVDTCSRRWGFLGETGTAQCPAPSAGLCFGCSAKGVYRTIGDLESFLLDLLDNRKRMRSSLGRACLGRASILPELGLTRLPHGRLCLTRPEGVGCDSSTPPRLETEKMLDASVAGD